MTENRITESLANAVENLTPNILEELMSELNINAEPKTLMHDVLAKETPVDKKWIPRKNRSSKWMKTLAGCAAALLVVVAGIGLTANKDAIALVSLDVNPAIEISIDDKERVIQANPINDEAGEILTEMDLKGSDIDVACNAIVGSMLTHGYLTDLQNSILLSVSAEDEQRGTEIERRLSKQINSYLENTEVAAAILGQYVNNDEAVKTYASEKGISVGKAWLIKNLLNTGSSKMKESDLLGLTTQELILLGQKRGVTKDVSYGNAESSKFIGEEKALSAALNKAGVKKESATNIKYEFDCENGVLIYEVSFRSGDYEYDYDINAYDGSIVSSEKEYDPEYVAPNNNGGSDGSSEGSSGGSGGGSGKSGSSSSGSGSAGKSSGSSGSSGKSDSSSGGSGNAGKSSGSSGSSAGKSGGSSGSSGSSAGKSDSGAKSKAAPAPAPKQDYDDDDDDDDDRYDRDDDDDDDDDRNDRDDDDDDDDD